MHAYRAFGLVVHATVPLAPLAPVTADAAPDLIVDLSPDDGSTAPAEVVEQEHRSPPTGDGEYFRVRRFADESFRFTYSDGITFRITRDGRRVYGRWPADMTREDTIEYLLGPIAAFVLRLRGIVCLHAAAVAAGDGCFAILAPSGHGKSTAAAACARRGWPIVTEDLLALQPTSDGWYATPSYPRVRLWPDAARGVFGAADALPRITPENADWDKRYLDLGGDGYAFSREPLRVAAIYTHTRRETVAPSFATLPPAAAMVTLLANVYTRWQLDRTQRAHEFDLLQQVAAAVPVRRYRGPHGLRHVDANVQALHDDCCRGEARPGAMARSGS